MINGGVGEKIVKKSGRHKSSITELYQEPDEDMHAKRHKAFHVEQLKDEELKEPVKKIEVKGEKSQMMDMQQMHQMMQISNMQNMMQNQQMMAPMMHPMMLNPMNNMVLQPLLSMNQMMAMNPFYNQINSSMVAMNNMMEHMKMGVSKKEEPEKEKKIVYNDMKSCSKDP